MFMFATGFFVCAVLITILNSYKPAALQKILAALSIAAAVVAGYIGYAIEKVFG